MKRLSVARINSIIAVNRRVAFINEARRVITNLEDFGSARMRAHSGDEIAERIANLIRCRGFSVTMELDYEKMIVYSIRVPINRTWRINGTERDGKC